MMLASYDLGAFFGIMKTQPIDWSKNLSERKAPLDMNGEQFRKLGHRLVDQIAEFLDGVRDRPVTRDNSPADYVDCSNRTICRPMELRQTNFLKKFPICCLTTLFSTVTTRFWGYITSSPAPIGALADLLASTVNPNVAAAILSPIATEIEAQTIRWIADLIGFPRNCGGLLVSGGNMANLSGFLPRRKRRHPGT
jgi:hypothetical protein